MRSKLTFKLFATSQKKCCTYTCCTYTYLVLVSSLNGVPEVVDLPIRVWVLEQHPTHIVSEVEVGGVLDHDLHAQVVGTCAHHLNRLRVAARVNQEHVLVVLGLSAVRDTIRR